MQRVVVLVQARMGSTRFPGKMLADLHGQPVLRWVLHRVAQATAVDEVVLATTDMTRDNPLVELAQHLAVPVYRGNESDVLSRFADAATVFAAECVVRVCADNPFIDPAEIDRLIAYFRSNKCDYACNHQDRNGSRYADGFGAEILASNLLQRIASLAHEARHREHVTLYLHDHANDFDLRAVPAPEELAYPRLRFDVDEQADLDFLNRIAKAVNGDIDVPAAEIVRTALKDAAESQ